MEAPSLLLHSCPIGRRLARSMGSCPIGHRLARSMEERRRYLAAGPQPSSRPLRLHRLCDCPLAGCAGTTEPLLQAVGRAAWSAAPLPRAVGQAAWSVAQRRATVLAAAAPAMAFEGHRLHSVAPHSQQHCEPKERRKKSQARWLRRLLHCPDAWDCRRSCPVRLPRKPLTTPPGSRPRLSLPS